MLPDRTDVLIVGAGISGLSTAFFLRHDHGLRAVVIEGAARAGGVIQSAAPEEGFLFDRGPQSVLVGESDLHEMIDAIGLRDACVFAPRRTNRRWIYCGGKLRALPMGPFSFATTGLLSPAAKLRLLAEPFVARAPRDPDESLASFVRRRLGAEALRNLISPFVSGVFAGDPERLSVRDAFWRLATLEDEGGSLVLGAIRRMARKRRERRERRRAGAYEPVARGWPRRGLFSFRGGLQRLPEAVAAHLGDAVRRETRAVGLQIAGPGERAAGAAPFTALVREGGGEDGPTARIEARRVVLCGRADDEARLLPERDAPPLLAIPYAPVAVAFASWPRERVAHRLNGFGYLARPGEGLHALGCIFTSTLYPDRCPPGHVAFTAYVGGVRHPERALADEHEVLAGVRADLERVLGVRGEPTVAAVHRWPRAISQYEPGHARRVNGAAAAEQRHPGLFLGGAWRDGVSVKDRVARGRELAARVVAAGAPGAGRPRAVETAAPAPL